MLTAALVEFYGERYPAAIELLDQAVAADPDDADALYQRGVCYSRLEDNQRATDDLRAALMRKPGMTAAALELGRVLYQLEDYDEAARWLRRAASAEPSTEQTTGPAAFYLGLVELRRENHDAAVKSFAAAAAAQPELLASSRFYQGVASFEAGRSDDAERYFAEVVDLAPDLEIAAASQTYLRHLRQGAARNYGFYGSAGFDYDSNVRLDAVDNSSIRGDAADGRAVLTAGAWYVPVQKDRLQLSLGYGFFQSLHFDLDAYNLQGHRASATVSSNAGRFRYGLTGNFDFYLSPLRLTGVAVNPTQAGSLQSFLIDGRVRPWITLPTRFGDTQLFYRFRGRDYLYDAVGDSQDGMNNAVGIRQYYPLRTDGRYLFAGYRFDREDKSNFDGRFFQYDGHTLDLGAGWAFPLAVHGAAAYAYSHQSYDDASGIAGTVPSRRDDEHYVSFVLRRPIGTRFNIVGGYYGTFHDSNQQPFEYNRHIGSVSLELKY